MRHSVPVTRVSGVVLYDRDSAITRSDRRVRLK